MTTTPAVRLAAYYRTKVDVRRTPMSFTTSTVRGFTVAAYYPGVPEKPALALTPKIYMQCRRGQHFGQRTHLQISKPSPAFSNVAAALTYDHMVLGWFYSRNILVALTSLVFLA